MIISILLLAGFLGQLTGFNSALVALFLGLLLQRFFVDRPLLMTKFHALTNGFFEPLFFIGIGLYFVQITPVLLIAGLGVFGVSLLIDSAVGGLSS